MYNTGLSTFIGTPGCHQLINARCFLENFTGKQHLLEPKGVFTNLNMSETNRGLVLKYLQLPYHCYFCFN
ncbi:unnamed protein product [Cyberlindnera jadinii]|uniref:Uncharacterized protein n=1 Tax=Cyberlindnera jadinii (strain ATCC 18201 / CBS 1600 / BCRC 20928 / JCM 3617 / NBRC 0987 / NRRL Y-1542) TaxID=983966 RepID=A0A0H5C7Z9_CYBJN|nr:unnamed protein product [Cyberlindnera jadinii]